MVFRVYIASQVSQDGGFAFPCVLLEQHGGLHLTRSDAILALSRVMSTFFPLFIKRKQLYQRVCTQENKEYIYVTTALKYPFQSDPCNNQII